ncbi:hypothetical protein TWF696_001897 [Orbilia brochopaga]|uniref:Borealin N-terminal domain-containing protein n=1 Tax=Orbilia brochopaga TaxID=3140254 RepID=A0AAV9U9M0_9PEZI
MPPIRRKKKGEDEPSEPAPAPKPTARSAGHAKTPSITTTSTTTSRANPLGNKTSRPINGQHPPDDAKQSSKLAVGRQNSTKHPSPAKPVIKTIAIIPEPKRDPSPVSPVSPIANDTNQLSLREPSPPSAEETQIVPHETNANAAQSRELEFQTPTSATRKRKVGRKISQFEKDRLIENIRYEVDRRAKALRQRYALQAEMLRQGIELRIGRVPYKMRNMTMGELYDRSIAATESAKEKEHAIEAKQVRKQLEDVRRLSNTATDGPPLKVSKKRAITPPPAAKPSQIPNSIVLKSPALKSPAPITATMRLVPQTSPVQSLPVMQSISPEKPPSFTQKAMTGIKNKLASKRAPAASTIAAPPPAPTTSLRTKTTTASAATTKKTTKTTKATKAKAATASSTATTAAPKKAGGRSLRSRK